MTTDDREIVLADPPTVITGTICNQPVPHSIGEPCYYNAMQHHIYRPIWLQILPESLLVRMLSEIPVFTLTSAL
jgi:hypothetical protein